MPEPRSKPTSEAFAPVIALADSFDGRYGLELLDEGRQSGIVRGRARKQRLCAITLVNIAVRDPRPG
jgi:hypothetical protein